MDIVNRILTTPESGISARERRMGGSRHARIAGLRRARRRLLPVAELA